MKKTLLVAMLFTLAMAFSSLWAVALSEGFEGTACPPDGWTMSYADPAPPTGNVMILTTEVPGHGGTKSFRFSSFATASNEDYNQYLVTPMLNTTAANTSFSFWYRKGSSGTAEVFKVGTSTTDNQVTSFTWGPEVSCTATTWTQYTNNAIPVGTRYIAINYYSDYMWYLYVDDVVGPDLFTTDIDMKAVSLTGNLTPTAGQANPYIVTVKNMGNLAASEYNVQLWLQNGTTPVASVTGTTLASGAEQAFTLNWNPAAVGPAAIYGKVVKTGDTNAANDQTAVMNVNVQPAGVTAITIGNGTNSLNTIPIDMYYKSSISESIFLGSEMNVGGQITGLAWYNTFVSTTLQNKPTKIWLGETTNTNLTDAWIPSTQLTNVFDGTVTYPAGSNTVTVTFTTPYTYGGGNLVVMANRPLDTAYFNTNDKFFVHEGGTGITREYHNDTTAPDPTAPPVGNVITQRPNTTFFILAGGGFITGTVSVGGTPLAGATVNVEGGVQTATTDAAGVYHLNYVPAGAHNIIATKHGYTTVTTPVTVVEEQTLTQNISLALLPQVTVTGHVVANTDVNVGIAGATINLTGYEPYTATTDASGNFTINNVFASQTYNYTVAATGFQPATGTVAVGTTNVNMGTIMVTEVMFPAGQVHATINDTDTQATITWTAPNPNAVEITEAFEGEVFPPADWTQVITNTGAAGTTGLYPTWCSIGTVTFSSGSVVPPEGVKQAALYWDYAHQDEWLITPQFVCPPSGQLNFMTYIDYGSTHLDHYYVKVSTDNGATWTEAWDATAQPAGTNYYVTPVVVDLNAYSGQQIKIAWQAIDGDDQGLWYTWAIDSVHIGSPTQLITFAPADLTARSASTHHATAPRTGVATYSKEGDLRLPVQITSCKNERPVIGYKVWRLPVGSETNEGNWTSITPNAITALTTTDAGWATLTTGQYKYAVKAIYTGNAASNPAFSNIVAKTIMGTLNGTVTRQTGGNAIANATVLCGSVSATTNAQGQYTMAVPTGTYSVHCTAIGYTEVIVDNVVINANPAVTTQNFALATSSVAFEDGFESYADFSIDFAPWTCVDVDQGQTYGFTGITFEHTGEAMAWIVFNPASTTPALTDDAGLPHGGAKYAACFATVPTPYNDDWMITPSVAIGSESGSISFWAKAFDATYSAEKFNVGVSTTGTTPSDFTIISGATPVQPPLDWTQYTYDLTAYAGQTVKVGIECVSEDQFILLVDDVKVQTTGTANNNPTVPVNVTALSGNYPNPFNPVTNISYSVKEAGNVTIDIFNVKGQKIRTLVNDVVTAGTHTAVWNGTDDSRNNVSSGVYFYKMTAGKYSSTKKMIMMK